ncbi:hypothetical protein LTR17_009845 [Elasticomyces elasticus]|nr:hypothetical protein LTR17_009845 [Elasticomyces elasticus]
MYPRLVAEVCSCGRHLSEKPCGAAKERLSRRALEKLQRDSIDGLKLMLEDAHPDFLPYARCAARLGLDINEVARAIGLRQSNGEDSNDSTEIERALLQVKQERATAPTLSVERTTQPYSWATFPMGGMADGGKSSTSPTSETSTLDHESEFISGSSQRRRGAGSDSRSRDDGCKDGAEVGRTEPFSVIYPVQGLCQGNVQDHQVPRQLSTEESATEDMVARARGHHAPLATQSCKRERAPNTDESLDGDEHRPAQRPRVPLLAQYVSSSVGTPREPNSMTDDVDADDGYRSKPFATGYRASRLALKRNKRSNPVERDVTGTGKIDPSTGIADDFGSGQTSNLTRSMG